MAKVVKKKKTIQEAAKAIISVHSSFNNTIITIADENGNNLAWSSAGSNGFKGTKKSTPYAAQITMKKALDNALAYNIKEAKVRVAGVGAGRESAVRAIGGTGIKVTNIKDITPVPHNGCRQKKTRRV
ncbi:TPA: 30S ribosomal protein S11 [Candidatus Berkelbacteria bacterium]|uniref:Small ribosomal subunit protein uS11 n=1 Tax=Berkelbacteria bacterium GW2011_GWE1_39_12 TaxID=1618337 RepID=A0A0G4B486_9BACT|nr:MAG: 30S ribosomal protein S11, small subunit ribosomal protein S11 [Berkelbacteria bacterium GW2011_GWE1_39_12]HBO60173.1 30S ribosomal protein S11 [Candidatus Berkelbacteria bacterium]